MPATFKAMFGAWAALAQAGLNSLANGAIWTSEAVDNSAALWQLIRICLESFGTGSSTAWLDIRILPISGDGVNFATWDNGIVLRPTIMPNNTEKNTSDYVLAPARFKLAVKNNTGSALAASGNVCYWQGRNEQAV